MVTLLPPLPNPIGLVIGSNDKSSSKDVNKTFAAGGISPLDIGALVAATKWGFGDPENWTQFLDTAIAVCIAESKGVPKAVHQNTNGTYDCGLWQINSVHKSELEKAGLNWSDRFQPLTNAEMAHNVFNSQGWGAWSTYNSGAYKAYTGYGDPVHQELVGHKSLIDNIAGKFGSITGGIAGDVSNLPSWLSPIMNFLKDAGIAIGAFVAGGLLVILGIWFIVSQTKAGRQAVKTAKTATKAAGVAALA